MSTNAPMTPEQRNVIVELLAEVKRLRARLTVDDAMVERAAEAIYLRCFLRWNSWATEARAKASLEAAKAGYIGYVDGWKATCEAARAALDAAFGTGEGS